VDGNIWSILGIAATDDRKAIRKAYATRLKQIDVETEAQKFIDLREAMEGALHLIQMAAWEEQQEEWEKNQSAGNATPTSADGDEAQLPDTDAPDQIAEDDAFAITASEQSGADDDLWVEGNRLYNEIIEIISSDKEVPDFLTTEEEDKLVPRAQAFFDWLDRSPISAAQAYEHELAYALAFTVPRSDPLLQSAVDHFGWDRTGQDWDRDPTIMEILSRLEGNRALSALMEPDHKWHQAYLELTGQGPKRPFWQSAPKKQIRELLGTVKAKYPSVEAALDPEALGKWERKLDVGSQGLGAFLSENRWLTIGVIIAISTCARVVDRDDSKVTVAPGFEQNYRGYDLSEPSGDIDIALEKYFGPHLTIADLQEQNVNFLQKLEAQWDNAKLGEANIIQFSKDIGKVIDDELSIAFPQTGQAELSAYWQARADIARDYEKSGALSCALFLSGQLENSPVPQEFRGRLQESLANILTNGYKEQTPASAKRNFRISGTMLAEIGKRTKLSQDKIIAALQGGGNSSEKCQSQLALIDIVTQSGTPESLEIMRGM
tara:strand:+ start:2044 stop:3687 length:1644 start_codon:yes stop_codon:yes gene_type:complete